MNIEEQIQIYHALVRKIAEMERQKKELGRAILAQIPEKKLAIPGYTVHRYKRFSFKITLEEARKINATKTEEVIDKDKLKELHKEGHPISGISIIEYIQVFSAKEKVPQ